MAGWSIDRWSVSHNFLKKGRENTLPMPLLELVVIAWNDRWWKFPFIFHYWSKEVIPSVVQFVNWVLRAEIYYHPSSLIVGREVLNSPTNNKSNQTRRAGTCSRMRFFVFWMDDCERPRDFRAIGYCEQKIVSIEKLRIWRDWMEGVINSSSVPFLGDNQSSLFSEDQVN